MVYDALEKSKKKDPHSAATSVQEGESRAEKIQGGILHPILSLYADCSGSCACCTWCCFRRCNASLSMDFITCEVKVTGVKSHWGAFFWEPG